MYALKRPRNRENSDSIEGSRLVEPLFGGRGPELGAMKHALNAFCALSRSSTPWGAIDRHWSDDTSGSGF